MDGYEVAIRIHERFASLHERPLVVALTVSADKVTRENCLRVGVDGVLLKPFSLDKMKSVLSELLEKRLSRVVKP
ncbi:Ethylene receptor [Thalictrum thalictroides]|nr:Ethylene receptor [Thalictrum thalictroides]